MTALGCPAHRLSTTAMTAAPPTASRSKTHASRTLKQRLAGLGLPALLAPAEVFAIGPLVLLLGNRGELSHGLGDLVPYWLLALAVGWSSLVALGLLLRVRWHSASRALLLGLGLVLWFQGSVWVGDYGVFDGRAIDWSAEAWRTPFELLLWLGLPALLWLLRRRVAPVAGAATIALLSVQGLLLLAASPDPGPGSRQRLSASVEPPPELFQLSQQRNGLLLVLDAFESDAFADFVEGEKREAVDPGARALRQKFDGFTFFFDHTGAFPNTRPSIPALLSGLRYGNDQPLSTFYPHTLKKASIIPALERDGWDVDMVSMVGRLIRGPLAYRYRLPRPFASDADIRFHEAMRLLDVSLFRHAPHRLKPAIYNHQQWRFQGLSKLSRNVHQASNGKDFLERFTAQLEVARTGPVFKIVHVGIPHLPAVLDADCRWVGVGPEQRRFYVDQARCAIHLVESLLDRLRALGVLDDMLIVIAADHGTFFMPRNFSGEPPYPAAMPWLIGRAMPLLLVKPPHAHGPLEISNLPSSITDVAATIASQLGLSTRFPGTPVFELQPDQQRARTYNAYFWEDVAARDEHFPFMHRFDIEGPVRDARSWHYRGTAYPAGRRLPARRLELGEARVRDYLGLGWSRARAVAGERFRWALGARSQVQVSLPQSALVLRARLKIPGFNMPQQIVVSVDGKAVATWRPPGDTFVELAATVPAGERPAISTVALDFALHRSHGEDVRPLAAQISWLDFEPDG